LDLRHVDTVRDDVDLLHRHAVAGEEWRKPRRVDDDGTRPPVHEAFEPERRLREHAVPDDPHADREFGPQVPLLEHERGAGTEGCQVSWEHLYQWRRRGPDDIHLVDPEGSSQRGACEREERCATCDVAPVMVLGRGHTYDAETVWERRLASASLTGHVRDGARDDGHAMPTRDEARRQLVVTRATRII